MAIYQNPEFLALFDTYTGGPTSIGANLVRLAMESDNSNPLLVATKADMVLYPGNGAEPAVESFRLGTRGFKELAAISHLGPALGSLVNMRAARPSSSLWRTDAERLLRATEITRKANSVELWRDRIAVEAFQGREQAIAHMVDYTCALTTKYLCTVLADESKLTGEYLRQNYLDPIDGNELEASVSMNAVQIATFFLVGLDISFRVTRWFKQQQIDWSRMMVLMSGQQGRVTSGVTWTSNSVCQIILEASDMKLPLERMYIAPHAPALTIGSPIDLDQVRKQEALYRSIWSYTRAISDLGPTMFEGFPRYAPEAYQPPVVRDDTTQLSEMPLVSGPHDMRAMTTRLRLVLEDPRQLLSGCITDYAAAQLRNHGNDYTKVVVPGLDGLAYPKNLL